VKFSSRGEDGRCAHRYAVSFMSFNMIDRNSWCHLLHLIPYISRHVPAPLPAAPTAQKNVFLLEKAIKLQLIRKMLSHSVSSLRATAEFRSVSALCEDLRLLRAGQLELKFQKASGTNPRSVNSASLNHSIELSRLVLARMRATKTCPKPVSRANLLLKPFSELCTHAGNIIVYSFDEIAR
jgi:hypothetical protein